MSQLPSKWDIHRGRQVVNNNLLGDKIWQLKGRQRIKKNLQSHRKTEDKPANIEEQIRNTGNTRGQEQTNQQRVREQQFDSGWTDKVTRCRRGDTENRAALTRRMWDRCAGAIRPCRSTGTYVRQNTRNTDEQEVASDYKTGFTLGSHYIQFFFFYASI